MNTLLEKLFNEQQTPPEFAEILKQIRQASEDNPQEWVSELEGAWTKVRELSAAAHSSFDDAPEDVSLAEFHIEDGKATRQDVIEAKAAAWDAFWNFRAIDSLQDALYEERAKIGYIMGIVETEGLEAWKKIKAEQEAQLDAQPVATDEDFPF
jgi:hypothetical protein